LSKTIPATHGNCTRGCMGTVSVGTGTVWEILTCSIPVATFSMAKIILYWSHSVNNNTSNMGCKKNCFVMLAKPCAKNNNMDKITKYISKKL